MSHLAKVVDANWRLRSKRRSAKSMRRSTRTVRWSTRNVSARR